MSYSFSFLLRKNGNLAVRFINNRRKAELNLEVRTTQDKLDEALSVLTHPKLKSELKPKLLYFSNRIKEYGDKLTIESGADVDVKILRDYVGCALGLIEPQPQHQAVKFTQHFQKFIDSKTNKGTKGVYKHTLDKIRLFDSSVDKKKFEDIDLKWLTDFEAFCAKTASKNARNIHLRNIRAVFNNAIDFDITTAYPFRRFKIRPEETRKRSLSVEELRRLFDYPVEPYQEIYRDLFKLIFLLIGINTADMHALKSVTSGRIEYKRAKTGRLYSIKVEPEAMEIIEKYRGEKGLLCIADRWSDSRNFRHQLNKALQRIGEVERKGRGGKKIVTSAFPGISSYWARHTWATIARKIGVSIDTISLALGHSSDHKTTRIYIDEDLELIDEANRRVLDWVLYGKC